MTRRYTSGFGWFMSTCTRSILLFARPSSKVTFFKRGLFRTGKVGAHFAYPFAGLYSGASGWYLRKSHPKMSQLPVTSCHYPRKVRLGTIEKWPPATQISDISWGSPALTYGWKRYEKNENTYPKIVYMGGSENGAAYPNINSSTLENMLMCIYIWYNDNQPW